MRALIAAGLFLSFLGGSGHPSGRSQLTAAERPPVVGLQVTVDGKSPSRLRIPAGQRATIGIPGKGTVGLTPLLRGPVIELVVDETAEGAESDATRELARPELRLDEVVAVETSLMRLDIKCTELIQRAEKDAAGEPEGPCMVCCVYCESQWQCACEVQTVCGHCCCPAACACSTSPSRTDSERSVSAQVCPIVVAAIERLR